MQVTGDLDAFYDALLFYCVLLARHFNAGDLRPEDLG